MEITWPPASCEAETIIKESLKTKQKAEIVSASLLSKVLILAYINVHKFGNYIEKEKDIENKKVGDRIEKLNKKKSNRELECEIKKQRR